MKVELEKLPTSQGRVSVHIEVSADMNFSAFAARRKVTGFVVDHISTNMHGGEPVLIVGERLHWRVPVLLSMPPTGDRGEVGAIEVDVETGQLGATPTIIEDIIYRATELALRPSLSAEARQ